MTTLGKNVKITAPTSARAVARETFAVLGAELATPSPDFDVFAIEGGRIGFHYVDVALTPEQMRIAPWLELFVDDVDATAARLGGILERLDYKDRDHPYFVGPAGVVFRLAARAS